MKYELIVKDNALINASYSLTLVEQRLILLAIISIRNDIHNLGLDSFLTKPIKITASSYIKNFNVDPSTAYKGLKEACKTLFGRQFSFQEPRENGKVANKTTRWVSDIAYIDNSATVEFTFAQTVLPLVTYLEKHLTSYELKQIANLTSGYAVRLYELLISWRSTGKTPQITLIDFRKKIGVLEHEYQRMGQFKEKVLDKAIEQINKHTDITVSYEQHKEGRSIVAFSFKFKQKKTKKTIEHQSKDNNISDVFCKLTESQLDLFSSKLTTLPEIQKMANIGEEMPAFKARIRAMLQNNEDQMRLKPYLNEIGFKA